jgi:DNA-binding Lrp family transcriptional regulator
MGKTSSGNHIYPDYKDMLIGGRKLQNYCAKHPGSKYNGYGATKPQDATPAQTPTDGGLTSDDGSTVQLSTVKTLSRGSRDLLQHLVNEFDGAPLQTSQAKLAKSLGYKTTEPVRKILNELQDKNLIREFKTGINNGTRVDLKVDAKALGDLLQENSAELSLSQAGEKLLEFFRQKNQKAIPINYRALAKEVGISSPNALKAGLQELEANGHIKKNSSNKGTVITVEGENE